MVSAKEKSGNSTNLLRVKKGLKKKKKKKAFELDVDACMIVYDPKQDDALQKGGILFNFEIEEELKNEFMGFDEQNVKINQMIITEEEEEEENLLDSSCTTDVASSFSSSEFLVEGNIFPSDELDEILNAFADNGDDYHQENMFDLLPLCLPPLPLTNAFIDNRLDSTFNDWTTYTMAEWDQLFI